MHSRAEGLDRLGVPLLTYQLPKHSKYHWWRVDHLDLAAEAILEHTVVAMVAVAAKEEGVGAARSFESRWHPNTLKPRVRKLSGEALVRPV